MIAIMFPCRNRRIYTEQTLPAAHDLAAALDDVLYDGQGQVILHIYDDASDDGTGHYVQTYQSTYKHSTHCLCTQYPKHVGLFKAMNDFFEQYANEAAWLIKIDNDTVIGVRDILEMLRAARVRELDIVGPKHFVMVPGIDSWEGYVRRMGMQRKGNCVYHKHVGGSGILVRASAIVKAGYLDLDVPRMESWTRYQIDRVWNGSNIAFCEDAWARLLDMVDYGVYSRDYAHPLSYYREEIDVARGGWRHGVQYMIEGEPKP